MLLPAASPIILAAQGILSVLGANWIVQASKKLLRKEIILFDLHGVLVAGDFEVEDLHEVPGTRDLVRRLRKNYFVAALTNMSPEIWGFWNSKYKLSQEFDAVFYSGKYGIRKPEARIFEIVMKHVGVNASKIIFIDDRKENVDAAKKLGMRGIVFENARQCEKELQTMGIQTR